MSGPTSDRVAELLLGWEESLVRGAPSSVAELCRDCPELAGELERKIARLQAVNRFLFSAEDANRAKPGQGANAPVAAVLPEGPPGYELIDELGRGGMGVVYKALQKSLGRLVAVKTLAGSRWLQPGSAARLRQEAQALSRLNHSHVVQVLDVLETEHALSIVLEYVEGESLAQRLNGSPLPAGEAAHLAHTLARALTAVHAQGILHRDIKPGNVLVGRTGEIKISDFGLSKGTGDVAGLTLTGELLGSPRYMSPEQAAGRSDEVDVRTDVYGLGATLYEMLTGRPPFVGGTAVETLDQVRGREPVAPRVLRPEIPRDLETICLKCLEKRPEKRYADAPLLADDLERFLSDRPTLARPISTAARAARWLKRHPAQAVTATTIVVAIAAVISLSTRYAVRLSGAERETDLQKQALDAELAKGRLQNFNLLAARIRERSLNRPRGWPADNLADLAQLGSETDDETRRMLRGEALRALCAPQLELVGLVADEFDNYGLAYSPDGRLLAAGINRREDGVAVVVLYDAETRQKVSRLELAAQSTGESAEPKPEGVRSLLFAPDGSRLFVGTRTGMIHVCNPGTAERELSWQAHGDKFVVALGLMPERDVLVSLAEDCTLRFWKLPAGQLLDTIDFGTLEVSESLVVVGTRVFLTSKKQLREIVFDPRSGIAMEGWTAPSIYRGQVALSPDQRTVLALGWFLGQHDLADGRVLRRFADSRHDEPHRGQHDLDIEESGRWAASCGYDGTKLWDVVSGSMIQAIPNSANQRVSAAFRPGAAELAVARDWRVEVWRITESGAWDSDLRHPYVIGHADLSRDGRTLVGVTESYDEQRRLDRWECDLLIGQGTSATRCLTGIRGDLPVSLSRQGGLVACSQYSLGQPCLKVESLRERRPARDIVSRHRVAQKPAFSADQEHLWYAEADEDGVGYLACVRTGDGQQEFRWLNERSQRESHRSKFFSIAVGTAYVAASSVDETVRFFDAAGAGLVNEVLLPGRTVDRMCLTGDEKSLVCGTREGRLMLLDVPDGRTLLDLAAHDDWITAVCASVDGLVLSACRDGTLAAWQYADGRLRELFRLGPLSRGIKDAVLSEDGRLLMILVESETGVRLLRLDIVRRALDELGLNW